MGTHKHGLPTSLDDEVLVGLIQLTKRRSNFTDAKVPVLALRADRAAGLAAERAELPADRGGAAPLGRRGPDVRERLVGQRGQELGRREFPRPRQRHPLRPRAAAAGGAKSGKPGKAASGAATTADEGPPALVELPLERGDLPELPERQPQAARPGVLPQAAAADDQADVPVPGQAVLPPRRGSTSTCGPWPASTSA